MSTTVMAAPAVLELGNTGEPETLDPHRYNLRLEETLLNDLFLGLTTFDAQGEIVPGAAERWQVSDDGLQWTFYLRNDLRWSDGKPLTAADFVYSFRRLQDPQTAASLAYFLYMVKNAQAVNAGELPVEQLGVSAADEHTFIVDLEAPYPYLLERLLYPTAFPVPAHVIEQQGDDWIKPEHWVSNGAYRLKDWQPQAHVELIANPHFISTPAISRVRYHPVVSEQSAYNRYRNKELHAIASFPAGELSKAKTTYPEDLHQAPLLSMMYLVFNTERAPFDDVRVRQALSLAIDQATLTDKVMRAGHTAAFSFAPGLLSDYAAAELPHRSDPMARRRDQAKALLAEAGYNADNPLRLTLRHVSTLEVKQVNLAITGMWRQIGVQAELHQSELKAHFADLRQGDFDVAWAGWVGENNPEHYLTLLQSSIGNVNYGRFKNPAFDVLLETAQQTASLKARNALLQEAEALVVQDYPVVPLYSLAVRRLVDPRLTGWQDNPRDMHQVRYLGWDE